jgi:hypothetical protein
MNETGRTRLEQMIAGARELDAAWDVERAERLRAGRLNLRDVRAGRERALRRGLLVAGGAGLIVLTLLRAASSAPAEREIANAVAPSPAPALTGEPQTQALATRSLSDAGYARD